MSTFNQIIKGNDLVLIDFFAPWCGPCKMMAPILDQLKHDQGDKVRILKVDVDKNPQLAAKHQVRGVPTLMMVKSGETLWRQSGVVDLAVLKKVISEQG